MSLHPAIAAVRRGVRGVLDPLRSGEPVVVATSGGADSLALLAAAVFEGHRRGLRIVGATVDHGLQQGSAAHAERVVAQMATLGADETVAVRVRVADAGLGPEAAARQARYAVLDQVAERFAAPLVLLGHTRDDQAETVLLGLTRGSGIRSLAGMRRGFDRYRRPLLDVSRTDTETACTVAGIEFWSDPHNSDPAFTRVRVRRQVLPMLEAALGPGVAATLARTADQAREDADFLDDVAERTYARLAGPEPRPRGSVADGGITLPVADLARLDPAIRRRVLRRGAVAAGSPAAELFHTHLMALDGLVTDWHGQRWIDLPGHRRGVRRGGLVHLEPTAGGDAGDAG
ncbi:MAG: tRNA lysidine(34) synthetase TilS [Nocardioides sp.]|uniref:tRNA lysidine(34) synthetase TilS n=1 Tax=Nocardioides sp. TaxID=35761 RepID=UPI0039E52F6A